MWIFIKKNNPIESSMNINTLKNKLAKRLQYILSPSEKNHTKDIVLQSQVIAIHNRGIHNINNLSSIEFSGFSQWGEDGIIDWLIERLPGIPQTFIEFGVEDYRESNTRLLLYLRNWRGLIMDGSSEHINSIRAQEVSWRFALTSKCAFINCENINNLITSSGLKGEIGLLSVDIDGNDYWVWQAIDAVSPVIVVCEFNAVLGDLHALSVPYDADFRRGMAHHSNLYFGASLPALIKLGQQKGYSFIGTNSNGCNAFFVRNDRAVEVLKSINHVRSFSSKFRESRDTSGQLTFINGTQRQELIRHLPIYDFRTQSVRTIADVGQLYSPDWQQQD
jgi:hypothetical protein